MKLIYLDKKRRISESIEAPYEGIFWYIDGELVVFSEQVDTSGNMSTTYEHKKIWNEIIFKYKLDNGCTVPYDYYPRGRVMVNPHKTNGVFDHYNAYIYIDDCINTDENIYDIICEFRLNKNCEIKYIGSEGGIESDHYRCHNCKR